MLERHSSTTSFQAASEHIGDEVIADGRLIAVGGGERKRDQPAFIGIRHLALAETAAIELLNGTAAANRPLPFDGMDWNACHGAGHFGRSWT
jgi:hypothetical protein